MEIECRATCCFSRCSACALSEKWGLYMRPVVTMVNSLPTFDQNGHSERTAGFGDTVFGVAAAHPLFGGRLVLGAGPTFAFPTASQRELGQDTWQFGPDVGATLLGKNFIAYAFVQQWFKAGGDGRDTNQMNGSVQLHLHLRKRVHARHPAEPLGRLEGARKTTEWHFQSDHR